MAKKKVLGMAKKKVLVMPTEVYSRVVGYYRPVNLWNDGKKQEFKERKYYDLQGFLKKKMGEKPYAHEKT